MTRKPGGVPTMFVGGIGRGHTKVRQRMCQLLESDEAPVLLDDTARRFLAEARKAYLARNLSQDFVIDQVSMSTDRDGHVPVIDQAA